MSSEAIGAVVLAAGGSTRLGEAKQFLQYRGETLVHRAVAAAMGGGCSPIVVVAGKDYPLLAQELADFHFPILKHDHWQRGIGSSIRKGVSHLLARNPAMAALLIMVCDQPYVTSDVITQLIAVRSQSRKMAVACSYDDTVGVPALFDRMLFSRLTELSDEQGAKAVLHSVEKSVAKVLFPEGSVDIDTPQDKKYLEI